MKYTENIINPLTGLDYPDPDVIRVGRTYYMVSTTMHFFPGCEILRSYDLWHWEHVCYVYETLDGTPAQKLENGENIYGKGMWAASLRYHNHTFYLCFVANDTGKTYLYHTKDILGPWEKQEIEGFYHDSSLLFDDDQRVYIVYGNTQIYITELNEELTGPKAGGLHRKIIEDGPAMLGYEGSHIYKINGKYYVFLIHSGPDKWLRSEAVFMAASLEGDFTGGEVLSDDSGFRAQGVAQGGIVDTPNGDYYAILFRDNGAVGRLPMLVPVSFHGDMPVFGDCGKMPTEIEICDLKPGHLYEPLVGSDDFKGKLHTGWQFNHEPMGGYRQDPEKGRIYFDSAALSNTLTQAVNTLTMRTFFPGCKGEVTLGFADMKDGDEAGLCILQGQYAYIGVKRKENDFFITYTRKVEDEAVCEDAFLCTASDLLEKTSHPQAKADFSDTEMQETDMIAGGEIALSALLSFTEEKDQAEFGYALEETIDLDSQILHDKQFKKNRFHSKRNYQMMENNHELFFHLDHFTGARFGLFYFSKKETKGSVYFSDFRYTI